MTRAADISNRLNTALEAHNLGTASGILDLEDLPRLLADVLPLWWEHTYTDYATIAVKAGTSPREDSPLIDSKDDFTACVLAAITSLRDRLADDETRTGRYREEHEHLLTLAFDLRTDPVTTTHETDFLDGASHVIHAGAAHTRLTLHHFPVPCAPADFDRPGDYNRVTRMTTVSHADQTAALRDGWRTALATSR